MLKDPTEFAREAFEMNGFDKIETLTALVFEAQGGGLKYMPANWIGEVIAAIMDLTDISELEARWHARHENGWTP